VPVCSREEEKRRETIRRPETFSDQHFSFRETIILRFDNASAIEMLKGGMDAQLGKSGG
jgi:hypothetical protein